MRNLCQIFCLKPRKICAVGLILCLIWGLTPAAESISVKLRGKIVLGGILSGLAYVTHALVTRDKRAVEKLHLRLGPPDRVIQFERGFDLWRIDYYGEQSYLFRNNRFIRTAPHISPQLRSQGYGHEAQVHIRTCRRKFITPFLIDTPFSRNPKWLRLCLLRSQRVPQLVSSCLHRLEDERLLGRLLWLSR